MASGGGDYLAPPGGIATIQRGSITISAGAASATATITAVNTAKAHVIYLGCVEATGVGAAVDLTNSTTVTAYKGAPGDTSNSYVVYYVVKEYS